MAKKNYKIAFISTGYGNSPVISGGEIRLFNIIKRLPRSFDPFFISTPAGADAASGYLKKTRLNFIKVRSSFFFNREISGSFRLWSNIISTIDAVTKIKRSFFDLIYSSSDFFCDIIPAFLYRRANKTRWAAMIHHIYMPPFRRPGNFIVNTILYWMQQFSFGLIASGADAILILDTPSGRAIEGALRSRGFKGDIFRVLNGIDVPRRPVRTKKDRNMAVYVGGLRPSKGLYDIAEIWKYVTAEVPSLVLHVAGRGTARNMKYLKDAVEKYGLAGRVIIEGFLSQAKMESYLKRSFIFALPSHEEGWGISIAEALIYNCHPVVYSLPAFDVFRDQVEKVPSFDTKKFAEKIVDVYRHSGVKRTPMAFLRSLDWSAIAQREGKIIKEILNK
jgi:glycosyltransferase involved in cell wall biosynthesis